MKILRIGITISELIFTFTCILPIHLYWYIHLLYIIDQISMFLLFFFNQVYKNQPKI